jgi:excinuclease ABC subunit C
MSKTPQSILKDYIKNVVTQPGIYQFYNQTRELLYVGKARNLKKRLSNYLRVQQSLRLSALISQIAYIETTVTNTENEALLLERNTIKSLRPYYNVLLRDDKSYPYIVLSEHCTPRLGFYRGKPKGKAQYFGPYPSVTAVKETLNILQKLFHLRTCRDTFFKNRSRPCLQYQIGRCSAPCVNLISREDYAADVQHVRLFLQGKNSEIIKDLSMRMEAASRAMNYEEAARLRDQITYLRQIQQQQAISTTSEGDSDVIAWAEKQGLHCIYILPIRQGQVVGGQAYFPKAPSFLERSEILSGFISQFYLQTLHHVPQKIIVDGPIDDQDWLSQTLESQHHRKIVIQHRTTTHQRRWLELAQQNATQALAQEMQTQDYQHYQRETLKGILKLTHSPKRLECFDISHTQGEATVASCVVFDEHGPAKRDYRHFNLSDIQPGDDYAAMQKALRRYYEARIAREAILPDILIVDGGKGQLTQAIQVLTELGIIEKITVLAIAKGPARKPGQETLFLTSQKAGFTLSSDNPALHLLQHIRDEAHRFAISAHRKKRSTRREHSILEHIPGIGPQRRRQLLTHFGGLQGLKKASVYELNQLHGISEALAHQIYTALKNLA